MQRRDACKEELGHVVVAVPVVLCHLQDEALDVVAHVHKAVQVAAAMHGVAIIFFILVKLNHQNHTLGMPT